MLLGEHSMPSPDTVSKRRSVSRQTRQAALRSKLFSHYRNDPRYQRLVADDLRPLWVSFEGDIRAQFGDAIRLHPNFGHMLAAVVGYPNSLLDPNPGIPTVDQAGRIIPPPGPPIQEQLDKLELYVAAVLQHVMSMLGLTWKGQPAAWAVQFVHADVTHASDEPFGNPGVRRGDDEIDRATVHVTVGPGRVGRQLRLEPPRTHWVGLSHPGDTHWQVDERQDVGLSGEDWRRLEERAHELLAQGIAQLRQWYEARCDLHNQPKLQGEALTIERLYRYLHPRYPNKRPKDSPATQKAIRRVAALIEVDVPSDRSQ
jgi:hypothetical protein